MTKATIIYTIMASSSFSVTQPKSWHSGFTIPLTVEGWIDCSI